MNVYDSQHRPLMLGEAVGHGGEASVYSVPSKALELAKIYEPAPRPEHPAKLTWMLGHTPDNPTLRYNHPSLAWPKELLYDAQHRLVGYLMPHIQVAVPVIDVFNPRRREEVLPRFDRRYLHRVARNLAASLAALHHSGYVVGDLNESNILVTPSALVTLIDTDSFQVQEQRDNKTITYPCPVGKPEYTPPELQGQPLGQVIRLPEHDAFGLGVLIFQVLMDGSHPFRAQWLGNGDPPALETRIREGYFPYVAAPTGPVRPPRHVPDLHNLHPEITDLIWRCFIDGHKDPKLRPTPLDWDRGIARAEKALILCRNNHYYSGHLRTCPYCEIEAAQQAQAAERPAPNRGQPVPARSVTGRPAPAIGSRPLPGNINRSPYPAPRPAPGSWRTTGRTQAGAGGTPAGGNPASRTSTGGTSPAPASQSRPTPGSPAWRGFPPRPTPTPQSSSPRAGSSTNIPSSWLPWPFSFPGVNLPTQVPGTGSGSPATGGQAGQAASGASPAGAPLSTTPGARSTIPHPPRRTAANILAQPPFMRPAYLRPTLQERAWKSIAFGLGYGSLAGTALGAATGAASWMLGDAVTWPVLFSLGGAIAGVTRGWLPGYNLGLWVNQYLGWRRFWQFAGVLIGLVLGGLAGMVFVWAIFPVFLGAFWGARLGYTAGGKLWEAGESLGWERIWGVIGAVSTATTGWMLASWLSSTGFGAGSEMVAQAIAAFMMDKAVAWPLIWAVLGGIGGGLGGAVAGWLVDIMGRLFGLVD